MFSSENRNWTWMKKNLSSKSKTRRLLHISHSVWAIPMLLFQFISFIFFFDIHFRRVKCGRHGWQLPLMVKSWNKSLKFIHETFEIGKNIECNNVFVTAKRWFILWNLAIISISWNSENVSLKCLMFDKIHVKSETLDQI